MLNIGKSCHDHGKPGTVIRTQRCLAPSRNHVTVNDIRNGILLEVDANAVNLVPHHVQMRCKHYRFSAFHFRRRFLTDVQIAACILPHIKA